MNKLDDVDIENPVFATDWIAAWKHDQGQPYEDLQTMDNESQTILCLHQWVWHEGQKDWACFDAYDFVDKMVSSPEEALLMANTVIAFFVWLTFRGYLLREQTVQIIDDVLNAFPANEIHQKLAKMAKKTLKNLPQIPIN